eukprot:GEMP01079961.1.p1 GENE.GEMP01079961.1~~GEMP01079961.1.p1  ORF type:complete len:123 (-),score=20.28 GEMP01079961.1:349-717(-)
MWSISAALNKMPTSNPIVWTSTPTFDTLMPAIVIKTTPNVPFVFIHHLYGAGTTLRSLYKRTTRGGRMNVVAMINALVEFTTVASNWSSSRFPRAERTLLCDACKPPKAVVRHALIVFGPYL